MSTSINEVARKYAGIRLYTPFDSMVSPSLYSHYNNVEYIWIDNISSAKLLSKTQQHGYGTIIDKTPLEDIPKSTYNIKTRQGNRCIKDTGRLDPVLLCKDPFHLNRDEEFSGLILCQNFLSKDEPTPSTKNRMKCAETMKSRNEWQFLIEQEFSFREIPKIENVKDKDWIRKTLESFNRACRYAGIFVNSFSIENHPQDLISYKIGPQPGLRVSDELWMSRYILQRVAEEFHLTPSFDPINDNFEDRCPHALYSFSGHEMYGENGMQRAAIIINKMGLRHRLDSNSYDSTDDVGREYLWERDVIGDFSEAVTIPLITEKNRKVFIEDRRPRGNSDPYVVTKTIVETIGS